LAAGYRLRAYTGRNLTRSKMSGAVGSRRLAAGGATTTWSREKLHVYPMGGGAVPRIPVVNADATRNAIREGGTMHETKAEGRAERTAVRKSALNDTHSIVLARIAVTLACLVIDAPLCGGLSPAGLCKLPDLDGPECQVTSQPYFRFAFRISTGWVRHERTINDRSHPLMSVEQNLFSGRAREFRRPSKIHMGSVDAMEIARANGSYLAHCR
jgi:hypothetical protein